MTGSGATRTHRGRKSRSEDEILYDRELEDLPPELRWREWMLRVEAVIFAAVEPVSRETLARVVGKSCSIELLIDDLREDLRSRPYDIVTVAGGWQHRSRSAYAAAIRASQAPTRSSPVSLSEHEAAVLAAIAYLQPVTRGELSKMFGKEVSRDTIASLRDAGFLGSGPRSPTPGAPYTYVTTRHFLSAFGLETLRDLPDLERLEDAGLLSRQALEGDALPMRESEASEND
ncbi:segregation and condensation protein B [Rhizobium altiplani]|uniref:Segregation and condensation protein B n=1 Tax=Rhizobium altiplani TaxID=1864509 RepID=A0A109K1Z5_9HYPH|nr:MULTISPECIES: SMC-Scp complex subunit ScpB [Rhizobium]KWV42303.1 segregation and condensation protein B [Rhizobium altiplani]KWV47975.1 segregation and condensation protein B [Rhizobium altiplani]KWV48912.1 segregation and condensation protein B [Rhizobium altiplani]KWV48991.1 segregation and condensation protein B [Rhizobium altiplani]KWV49083.1 segregation and condensation protein B [Rhizobium altiplani]